MLRWLGGCEFADHIIIDAGEGVACLMEQERVAVGAADEAGLQRIKEGEFEWFRVQAGSDQIRHETPLFLFTGIPNFRSRRAQTGTKGPALCIVDRAVRD